MKYRVVASRGIWGKAKGTNPYIKQVIKSRLDYMIDTNVEYSELNSLLKEQFKGWFYSISELKEVQNGY
jgi:hypothetical protein